MTDSQQTEQLRTKAKQFAIGILKLFGGLPKTYLKPMPSKRRSQSGYDLGR